MKRKMKLFSHLLLLSFMQSVARSLASFYPFSFRSASVQAAPTTARRLSAMQLTTRHESSFVVRTPFSLQVTDQSTIHPINFDIIYLTDPFKGMNM